MAPGTDISRRVLYIAAFTAVVAGFYASALYSYVLFHTIIEFTTVSIAFTLFTITWNTRRFLTGGYLKALGVGYGLIAVVDLLHTLSYKGLGVFPQYDANLPTQLWIAARALEAILLCLAPFLVRRDISFQLFSGIALAAVSATTAAVFLGHFPDCFIEGKGLTPFKIASEYVISLLLLVALGLYTAKRSAFNARVFQLIVISILCTIGSELAFTYYLSVYDHANMVGHFLKLAAFYLIYRALVVTGFQEPFELIFRDLKQAEHALQREQVFSRCLLESMADGVVACDAGGILTLFNRAARRWHGLDPVELPPEQWSRHYDLFRPDGATPLPTDEIPLARAFRGETVTDAGMAIKATGQPTRFIVANGSVITDETGEKLGAVVVMRDVTEVSRLEQELRSANEELEKRVEQRTVELHRINQQLQIELAERERIESALMLTQFSVDHAADGIMWVRPDGSCCYANDAASRLLGYSAKELLRLKVWDLNPAHPMEIWARHWEEIKQRKTLFFETTLFTRESSPIPVEIHANHVVFGDQEYNCASVRDVSERKSAEESLRKTARDLKEAQRIAHVGSWQLDLLTGQLTWSDEIYDIFEIDPASSTPSYHFFLQAIHPDDRQAVDTAYITSVRTRTPYAVDHRLLLPGGRIKYVHEQCETFYDNDTAVRSVGTVQDVTGQKLAEDRLRRLSEELEQRVEERTHDLEEKSSELVRNKEALMHMVGDLNLKTAELSEANCRLQELDQLKSMFIASMSHELRTPLNSIIGFSSILQDEWLGPMSDEQKENLAIILRSGKHLLNLINDVIDVSKIEAGKLDVRREEFDLGDLMREALQYVDKDIREKGLELGVELQPLRLVTDRRRLLQCVINLLTNSVKFTERGSITVRTGTGPDGVEISVTDSGIGIAKEDIARLFKPFVRLDTPLRSKSPGTGLGLYLTRKLVVEVLRGDVACKSEYGKGSTFTIYFRG